MLCIYFIYTFIHLFIYLFIYFKFILYIYFNLNPYLNDFLRTMECQVFIDVNCFDIENTNNTQNKVSTAGKKKN